MEDYPLLRPALCMALVALLLWAGVVLIHHQPQGERAWTNPAAQIGQGKMDIDGLYTLRVRRAGPSVVISSVSVLVRGQEKELQRTSCEQVSMLCYYQARLSVRPSEVGVCAASDILPGEDFCSRRATRPGARETLR